MPSKPQGGDWGEYRREILGALQRLDEGQEAIKKKLDENHGATTEEVNAVKMQLAILKTEVRIKSGMFGFIAGVIPSVASLLYTVFKR